jgi:hypothetical protein
MFVVTGASGHAGNVIAKALLDLSGRGRKEKSVLLNKSDDSYKAGLLG